MPSERTRRALVDIIHHAALAEQFVGDLDAEVFATDLKAFHAATRCLEIVSEAVRRAGPEFRDRHPHLPWRQMMDAGNVYRHNYDNVVETLVWRAVRDRLPDVATFASEALGD